MNYRIKYKIGLCIDCDNGVNVPLIAGRCQYHYKIHRHKINEEKRKSEPKKILETVYGIDKDSGSLVLWFSDKMQSSEPICENCGSEINKFNTTWWHGSQAHILPKNKFKSIRCHPHNHMVLSMYNCSCHGQYDSSWENASKMPVFELAKKRFLLFKDCISKDELRFIPDIFLQ